jgi:hypothetical protein
MTVIKVIYCLSVGPALMRRQENNQTVFSLVLIVNFSTILYESHEVKLINNRQIGWLCSGLYHRIV